MKRKFSKVMGRKAILMPNHQGANNNGYILYSRYIMEKEIGRCLESSENVHHINGDVLDDRLENLELLRRSEHIKLHHRKTRILDYDWIKKLKIGGLGYKRIMRRTGYPRSSIRSAIKVMGA